jgi:hypothetical protein
MRRVASSDHSLHDLVLQRLGRQFADDRCNFVRVDVARRAPALAQLVRDGGERRAGHQLHREPRQPVRLAHRVHGQNRLVVQARGEFDLACEARLRFGERQEFGPHEFHGHVAPGRHRTRAVHDAHAAGADALQEFEVAESGRDAREARRQVDEIRRRQELHAPAQALRVFGMAQARVLDGDFALFLDRGEARLEDFVERKGLSCGSHESTGPRATPARRPQRILHRWSRPSTSPISCVARKAAIEPPSTRSCRTICPASKPTCACASAAVSARAKA